MREVRQPEGYGWSEQLGSNPAEDAEISARYSPLSKPALGVGVRSEVSALLQLPAS
jgi:hypothetical protein